MVKINNLTVFYGDKIALDDVSLNIEAKTITGIIGPNGAGKSSLIKAMFEFVNYKGEILIFGKKFAEVKEKIAYVPQSANVNWDFPITVFDVVLMGQYKKGLLNRYTKSDKEKAIKALENMNLLEVKDNQISELSGGQKQRVFIARALCQDADLIVMDEPFASVDKVSERIIVDKMFELKQGGKTIVCVHHDLNTVEKYFDNIVMLNKKMLGCGKTVELFTKQNIDNLYGGI